MNKLNKKGQVAVEFILMFVLVVSVIIYAYYFAVSFAAVHYRSYQTFMVGRTIFASTKDYQDRKIRADAIMDLYEQRASAKLGVTKDFKCDMDPSKGFRGTMDYGYSIKFNVFSNAGLACSFSSDYILPALITRNSGNNVELALESMTGSEISDDHCKCSMQIDKTWLDCLNISSGNQIFEPTIDNGC